MALILGEYYKEDTTEMYLSGTNLTMIPSDIFKLTNLEVLHLNHNQIKTIPKKINQLKKLKSLKISYNRLDSIPHELFALSQLENLHLSHNRIKKVTYDLTKLIHLKELYLFGNDIRGLTLPKYINNLDQIKEILNYNTELIRVRKNIAKIKIQVWIQNYVLPKYCIYTDDICINI